MASASISRAKPLGCSVGLWVLFSFIMVPHLSYAANKLTQICVSSCGKISNITYPFRIKGDPEKCGDPRYELECMNDVAVLRLSHAEYHVHAINYNNYTIRLVDPNIQESDCSSIPRYFLYKYNFSDVVSVLVASSNNWDADLYHATQCRTESDYASVCLFKHIIYLSCNSPVSDDSSYVDNTSCVDQHTYVVAGDINATGWGWKPGCHIKLIAATSGFSQEQQWHLGWDSDLGRVTTGFAPNVSYSDIHRALAYGFELSWLHISCERQCGSKLCSFNQTAEELVCHSSYIADPDDSLSQGAAVILNNVKDYLSTIFWNGIFDTITLNNGVLLRYMAARVLVGAIFLVVLLIYKWRRRHLSMYENIESFLHDNDLMPIRYSYKEIKKMTKNFNVKLGQGGFGSVYEGKLRSGPRVAIKMLDTSKGNGQDFISEVATIGRIHHVNVVRLIGFCADGSKRALVYDFMPNGSVDKYIFSEEGSVPLSYEKIFEISLGIARGISYLHQGCDMQILHFDIKPHNILLDENFIPKVSDFGLAKLYPIDHSIVTLNDKRGTIGYIAPELLYSNIGGVSYKADVYSFGMLLMEMANKRKNLNRHAEKSSEAFFPTWIHGQFSKGKDIELDNVAEDEKNIAKKMIMVALWCIQLKPSDRPSMKQVVEMLEGDVESLTIPPQLLLYPNETYARYERLNSDQSTSDDLTNATQVNLGLTTGNTISDNCFSGEGS